MANKMASTTGTKASPRGCRQLKVVDPLLGADAVGCERAVQDNDGASGKVTGKRGLVESCR